MVAGAANDHFGAAGDPTGNCRVFGRGAVYLYAVLRWPPKNLARWLKREMGMGVRMAG